MSPKDDVRDEQQAIVLNGLHRIERDPRLLCGSF
jgi:hypothetical protein